MLKSIYVINLDNNKERLEKVKESFDKYNLPFQRYSAIYGKNLSNDEIEEKTTYACNQFLCTPGMIGCALSHVNLWKQLLEDEVDYYIIMEDDAQITERFIPVVNEIEERNLDFDILFLRCMSNWNCIQTNVKYTLSDGSTIGTALFPLTMASYIISKKGAEKLVPLFETIKYHIDVDLSIRQYKDDLKMYTISPNIVELTSESDKSTLHDNNIKSPTLYLINKVSPKTYWYASIPIFCFQRQKPFSFFFLFLMLLLLINVTYFKSKILYAFILLELIIYFL